MRHLRPALAAAATAWSALAAGSAAAEAIGEPSGSGPFPAIAETREGLPDHTVYRPLDWPQAELPLFVWGNGGCSNNGLAHAAYLRQIASQGYVIVALGVPGGRPVPDQVQCRKLFFQCHF